MKAPRSLRSKVLLGVGVALVLALYVTQFMVSQRSGVVAVLTCVWLGCLVAYLVSRAQDVRTATYR